MGRAIDMALSAARDAGIDRVSSMLIQSTNHSVFWLSPHPIIAKVSTRPGADARLLLEHSVAAELAALDAPIATPLENVRPWRHPSGASDSVVTLWNRLEREPTRPSGGPSVGASLRTLHAALARCRTALPGVQAHWHKARSALDRNDGGLVEVSTRDHDFLRAAFDDLVQRVEADAWTPTSLHGEPHNGNVLSTSAGHRWIDLETACRGPLEWDAVFLTPEAREELGDLDSDRVTALEALKSACVATWCFAGSRDPAMRRHADHHLEVLRSLLARHG